MLECFKEFPMHQKPAASNG
jgi:hypothetical protein